MSIFRAFLICGLAGLAIIVFSVFFREESRETIIFFPINESVKYQSANTGLAIREGNNSEAYIIEWDARSALGQKAYLRQDVGLLFKNGKLIEKIGDWRQNTDSLKQARTLEGDDTAKYEGITFHHSELHSLADKISSAQHMSSDFLYVIKAPLSTMTSFRVPQTAEEEEWKLLLDKTISNQLEYGLSDFLKQLHLKPNQYTTLPLTDLPKYTDRPLPGLSLSDSKMVIGKLWEGLYKNYFHGIKKTNGTVISPIGSTIPLLVFTLDKNVLYVLTRTSDGETVILAQQIGGTN